MHRGNVLRIAALASLSAGAAFAAQPIGVQPHLQITPVSKTTLEVQRFSGEFEEWARTWTITAPGSLTFRWQTGELPTLSEYKTRFPNHCDPVARAFHAKQDEGGVRYALIDKLGSGGFGTVFRARDTELQRDVAVKVLNRDRLASPTAVNRFQQEIRILAGIEHQGVVRVYLAWPLVHRIKQLPKLCLVLRINRHDNHEVRLGSHSLLFEYLISCRLVMRHVVHVVPQRR